ncbi:hypothetical protein MAPG_10466 [Magnaporthiopsis poae ATCC 64411]|uniref:Mitochondrial adapter protein MCP1 transmembrane domain-containing protein n=1 Tax=Magnaporthiopsis poae (strain ATCC 64411 / 73-15) TaxID=644358 RepID=A0A0C4ECN5_MAGP6|nr:hypothetical protein MAPG_10466 [Magnaporthiopsis poae ATCC 64411]
MDRYSRSLRRRASQDTIFSLLELEPSPMDSEKDLPEPPEKDDASSGSSRSRGGVSSTGSTTASLGLSGTGHGPVWYLTRIQRWSSYTFTIFASVHLATTSLVPLVTQSVAASESYLLLSREIYQTRLSEPLLVTIPLVAHVASGMVLRLGDSADVGLAYVAHGFARHPVVSWTAYAALLGLGVGHAVWGWARWLGVGQGASWSGTLVNRSEMVDGRVRKRRRRTWLLINTSVVLVGCVWAGGLGVVAKGGLTPGWVGELYDGLFQRVYL